MSTTMSRLFALFVILISSTTIAVAENRLALVVGNDNYSHVTRLQKAVNDATSMAQTLETLGFEVHQAYNTSRREMNFAVQQFVNQIEPGDIAMVFFAGHGVEIKGENFLLPIDIPDAKPGQEGFVKGESISLNDILLRLKEKKAQLNIVILDACRNNPFSSSAGRSIGGTRGLARIAAPRGTFVMYSADTGEAALDRLSDGDKSNNSVFTRLLIPRLKQPGLHLVNMARQVRRDVRKLALTVSHQQTPAYYDAVLGDFFIAGRKAKTSPPQLSSTPTEQQLSSTEHAAPRDPQEKSMRGRKFVSEDVPFACDACLRKIERKFAKAKLHKAIAISTFSAVGWATGYKKTSRQLAVKKALKRCNERGQHKCEVYAINGEVVWDHPEPILPPKPWIASNVKSVPFDVSKLKLLSTANQNIIRREYSKAKSPKALAVGSGGAWAYYPGAESQTEAMRISLQMCAHHQGGKACRVAAVNGKLFLD